MRRIAVATSSLMIAAAVVPAAAAVSAQADSPPAPAVTVVASHLNNPRGLAWENGQLYVAEAGRGGKNICATDPTGSTTCVGTTGAISRVTPGHVTRLVRGLFSVSGEGGIAAEGMVAVSVDDGQVYGQMAASPAEIPPTGLPQWIVKRAQSQLGQFGMVRGTSFATLAGVGAADFAWTAQHQNLVPDQFPDANPNGLLVDDGTAYVADAGANALSVVRRGDVKVAKFFGTPSGSVTDAVTTCVAEGPDHALYLGELLGGSFEPGHARIWRVSRENGQLVKRVWARGLTTVQGCGFDRAGNFYATEFQVDGLNESPAANPMGAVVKIAPDGTRTTLGEGQLYWPSGFAAGRDGAIYVSNCSISPGSGFGPCPKGGQVVRIG